MSLSIIESRAGVGTSAPIVNVEVHLSRGLPSCSIVGLPATAVKESRDRVRGAILNSGFEFPRQRIIVNLAPADLPKEGGRFDLPIAIGILAASGQIKSNSLDQHVFLGELALDGGIREIRGSLIAALSVKDSGQTLVLPRLSACQAALVEKIIVYQANNLTEVAAALNGIDVLQQAVPSPQSSGQRWGDFSEVAGQQTAKRALEISAAGHHSVLMTGPPGAGKTMLASRIGGILPPMTENEAIESAAIASIRHNGFDSVTWRQRPFRAPHHSASGAALIGGGSIPAPGEISLAHNGVLFLDELPEFGRHILELLREPMESGVVNISRAARQCQFLSKFLLVAAANPCPCGYFGSPSKCRCTPDQVNRYRAKLSGPLLDRIDMHLDIKAVKRSELRQQCIISESSASIQRKVTRAREIQLNRQGKPNCYLAGRDFHKYCQLRTNQSELLDKILDQYQLSTRAYHRILKLARTIADLGGHQAIQDDNLLEATRLRCREMFS